MGRSQETFVKKEVRSKNEKKRKEKRKNKNVPGKKRKVRKAVLMI